MQPQDGCKEKTHYSLTINLQKLKEHCKNNQRQQLGSNCKILLLLLNEVITSTLSKEESLNALRQQ